MKYINIPTKFPIPFANSAVNITNPIPTNYTGVFGSASLQLGFPKECIIPVGNGGTEPFGKDFNGIFFETSAWAQWAAAGNPIQYDSGFSSSIGGYPQGAMLVSTLFPGNNWLSTQDNNTNNPDTVFNNSGWIPFPGIIDSSYTWGVHGTGVFSSLNSAFLYLSRFDITQNGLITLNIAAGQFSYGTAVTMDHPNADRIAINGAGYTGGTATTSFIVTGFSGATLNSNGSATLTNLRSNYSSELLFFNGVTAPGSCMQIVTPGLQINNLLITCGATAGPTKKVKDTAILDVGNLLSTANVSVCNGTVLTWAGQGIFIRGGAGILTGGLLSSSWSQSNGIAAEFGGYIAAQPFPAASTVYNVVCTSNASNGLFINNKGAIQHAPSIFSNQPPGGPYGIQLICNGNTLNGASVNNQSSINAACIFSTNGSSGGFFFGASNGNITGTGTITSNNANGILAQEGSFVNVSGATISGNTGTALVAQTGSFIDDTGGGATTSPAANTVGNDNSYVKQ